MESSQQKLPPNPCDSANFLSKTLFAWIVPFFKKGYQKILSLEDMYQPMSCDKSEILGNRLEANWTRKKAITKSTSLLSVLFITFWKDYAILSSLSFFNDIVFRLGQPFLLGYLLQFFRAETQVPYHEALMYAAGILLLNAFNAVIGNHIQHVAFHNGMKVRVAVCSLIYRKSLRLSQTALGETSPGKIVNLLSNDVNRFDWASFFFNTLWIAPLLTFIVGCLMFNSVGAAGLVGILVVFAIVPILSYVGKLTSKYRLQTAIRTDERVRFMDEIVSGVQVIKMYAWEKPFSKLINHARKMELKVLRKTSYIRGIHMTFLMFTTRMALFCTMLTIVLLHGPEQITADRIFVISSYFTIVSHLMSLRFSRAVAEVAEVKVALKRLETFLSLEEKKTEFSSAKQLYIPENKNAIGNGSTGIKVQERNAVGFDKIHHPDVCISIKNFTARWTMPKNAYVSTKKQSVCEAIDGDFETKGKETLSNLNIDFPRGKLIGVIGPVGAGKSSLLQAILWELPSESGLIHINGSISYASQEPFVFSASVRQNILFGKEYDRKRYKTVIQTCALEKDFEQFEEADRTIVGERGASLSGGQKARINLARACYRDADIYLFDDPLSAVDAHVGTHIFEKCIGPKSYLAKQRVTRILVTHQVHFLKEADWIIVLKDGKIDVQGSPAELYRSGVDFIELIGITETPEVRKFMRVFSRQDSETFSIQSESSISSLESESENPESKKNDGVQLEASSKGKIEGSLIINYLRAGVNWPTMIVMGFAFLFVQFLASGADYFVSVWTKQEEMRTSSSNRSSFYLTTDQCMIIQGTLVISIFLFGISRALGFYSICVRISHNIHNAMFKGIISTTMRFFDTNPSGRVLNRFSKDIGVIDEFLPKSILDSVQNILGLLGSVILAGVVNPYLLIPVFVLSIFFIFFRKVYLKTSKNTKRLEAITKSPAFTHMSATLSGLSTVRAYQVEEILKKEFDNYQDTHSACWFMFISSVSAFSLSMDILCLIFMTCIIFYYMLFDSGVSGEKIGLVISQAINLTGLVAWGVRQSSEVSNQMTSVERLLEYRDLEPEKQPKRPVILAKDWPSSGSIEFRNVFYKYSAEAEPVLRGLSFVIRPREKIGIVGRTGAGKSSLIGAIFRLAIVEGEILLDGIDTANIQLSDLRRHIAIIPQDPVLFSGTLRRNLDPFEEYSDADIWNALESVELKNVASETLGLQSPVLPHGVNYSVGQRQLLCLARAILRKNRILVLDEATANVDPQTDSLIQQTIREKFTECTVLTVAHRLHTIIDSDRVLVMDFGQAVEFDVPHNLLQDENGIFCDMIKALGEHEFNRLSKVAEEKLVKDRSDGVESIIL